ncbi:MAG: alanine racemase [Firmicutes bacterium]|nr:alanine racemase [Bacillota bacterium]
MPRMLNQLPARWVEVDLDAIIHNLKQVRSLLAPGVSLMAVVKADAYGHGAVEVARTVLSNGADRLAVTTLDEAIELREAGITAPILVFSPLLKEENEIAIDHDLAVTVGSAENVDDLAEAAEQRRKPVAVHLKVETGMGRTGAFPAEAIELGRRISSRPGLKLEGVYTHFAVATLKNKSYTEEQFRKLMQVINELEKQGVQIPLRHACNSAATLDLPHMHLNLVRVGTLLYGQYPSLYVQRKISLKDSWQLKARIVHLKEVPAGTSIGYGRTYRTTRPARIAVLPIGYVDGYTLDPILRPDSFIDLLKFLAKDVLHYLGFANRHLSAEVNGRRVPVVGKVAMQLCMLEFGLNEPVRVGDVVRLMARRTTISPRLPKLYVKDGRPYKLKYWRGEEYLLSSKTEAVDGLET